MTNLLHHFADAVARYPDRIAIVDGKGHSITFKALQARVEMLVAYWHSLGVGKGDKVLIAMPLGNDLYASLAALWSLGATVILPEPAMGLAGLRHAARTTGVTAYCASGFYCLLKFVVPELRSVKLLRLKTRGAGNLKRPSISDDDIALISFTSGTSGKPKAIPRSHGFLMAQYRAIAPLLHSVSPERDLIAFPVFTLINIASGQTSVLPNWKMSKLSNVNPDDLFAWCDKQDITRVLIPPVLCEKFAYCIMPQKLHTIFTGGGPVFPDVLDKLYQTKNELRVICVYGSTEAEPIAHLDGAAIEADDKVAMLSGQGLLVGHPVDDINVRIIDNEIQVAGDHVNGGYLDPAHDVENKIPVGEIIWHRTGDAGAIDREGRLWLLGRIGTEVLNGDQTLFPFSVEVMARQWEGVDQCALMQDKGTPVLVIQGDVQYRDLWERNIQNIGRILIKHITLIPKDKRHASKIDRSALNASLKNCT